ncbi:MAG: MBL fold metallo-hydrolase [Clostridia bacterium]|nr:MBL fold metallo-hydrolase [Clostridia bacterium]
MIEISTLFSGSSGNSTLIRTESCAILIDAGRNCKAVCEALHKLGMTLDDIRAVFVTHEHSDHISALDVMMRKRAIPIHVTEPSSRELCKKASAAQCAVIHKELCFTERVGDLTVTAFPLPHDSAANVGYVITCDDGDCAGVATDMGYPTQLCFERLRCCRQAVLEANHDPGMVKNGPYPRALKERILSRGGHLSNSDCAQLIMGLCECGMEKIMLAHLSLDNNTPDKAREAVSEGLSSIGLDDKVTVKVAWRDGPRTL